MGFIKFALLATAGELVAIQMATGKFSKPCYLFARLVIWGFIGICIPAHTVTFILPSEYQVMLAALLSAVLGIILDFKKKVCNIRKIIEFKFIYERNLQYVYPQSRN